MKRAGTQPLLARLPQAPLLRSDGEFIFSEFLKKKRGVVGIFMYISTFGTPFPTF